MGLFCFPACYLQRIDTIQFSVCCHKVQDLLVLSDNLYSENDFLKPRARRKDQNIAKEQETKAEEEFFAISALFYQGCYLATQKRRDNASKKQLRSSMILHWIRRTL